MIRWPHAPEGVRSEFGTADELAPGWLFRFVDGAEWFEVYDLYGCSCGEGPAECIGCRGEQRVEYGRTPHPGRHYKYGTTLGDSRMLEWVGGEVAFGGASIPEVEFVCDPTSTEKAALLATFPNSKPWQEQSNDRD